MATECDINARSAIPASPLVENYPEVAIETSNAQCLLEIENYIPNQTTYRVLRPVVNRTSYEYKNISFSPGDTVVVRKVGGCVQTGGVGGFFGVGGTWKRYTDPSGDNADRLYYGSIEVPGVIEKQRLSQVTGQRFNVNTPDSKHLILYYMDDEYADNGYYSHDQGNNDQCRREKDGSEAYLEIVVAHNGATPVFNNPWDLLALDVDQNGLYLNPIWQWQALQIDPPKFLDAESSQISSYNRSWTCNRSFADGLGGGDHTYPGHTNLFNVTYTGPLLWESHDTQYPFGDDDYNINIVTPKAQTPKYLAGTTPRNPDHIHGEFDSDETIDHFDDIPWWKQFHYAVDLDDNAKSLNATGSANPLLPVDNAKKVIDGHDGIMMGLMGLDTFHFDGSFAGSEIHPVHALAIRTLGKNHPASDKDGWAIFVRNWGNQGYCGSNQQTIESTDIILELAAPNYVPNNAIPIVTENNFRGHKIQRDVDIALLPGKVVATFHLALPEERSFVVGEVKIQWQFPTSILANIDKTITKLVQPDGDESVDDTNEAEEESAFGRKLVEDLKPEQRILFDKLNSKMQVTHRPSRPLSIKFVSTPPTKHSSMPLVSSEPSNREESRQWLAPIENLCIASGGVTPVSPKFCAPENDQDNDKISVNDNCPFWYNPEQTDLDGDGFGNACDNCPTLTNPGQEPSYLAGVGASCVGNAVDPQPLVITNSRPRGRSCDRRGYYLAPGFWQWIYGDN